MAAPSFTHTLTHGYPLMARVSLGVVGNVRELWLLYLCPYYSYKRGSLEVPTGTVDAWALLSTFHRLDSNHQKPQTSKIKSYRLNKCRDPKACWGQLACFVCGASCVYVRDYSGVYVCVHVHGATCVMKCVACGVWSVTSKV